MMEESGDLVSSQWEGHSTPRRSPTVSSESSETCRNVVGSTRSSVLPNDEYLGHDDTLHVRQSNGRTSFNRELEGSSSGRSPHDIHVRDGWRARGNSFGSSRAGRGRAELFRPYMAALKQPFDTFGGWRRMCQNQVPVAEESIFIQEKEELFEPSSRLKVDKQEIKTSENNK